MVATFENRDDATEYQPTADEAAPAPVEAPRPEWLPAKFVVMAEDGTVDVNASSAKMAGSYGELEKRFSNPDTRADKPAEEKLGDAADPDSAAQVADTPAGATAVEAARTHFAEHGALDDATYAQLASVGIDRETVDNYIANETAKQSSAVEALLKPVGGAEQYAVMTTWAGENLSAAEVAAFNKIVEGNDTAAAGIAIEGLASRYRAAVGWKPTVKVSGDGNTNTSVTPYSSQAEMLRDMGDTRYKADPAFRDMVKNRLRGSNF